LNLAFEESNVTALIISNIGRSRAEVVVKRSRFNPDSNTAVFDELNPLEYYTTISRWEPGHLRGFGPIPVFHGDISQVCEP
jgi:hypothetical protein